MAYHHEKKQTSHILDFLMVRPSGEFKALTETGRVLRS
jgi:hypothetical protein